MSSLLELWADTLNAPLRNIFCNDLRDSLDRLSIPLTTTFTPPFSFQNPIMAPFLVPPGCTPVPIAERPNVIGGQCTDVLYRVQTATRLADGTDFPFTFINIVGPITGVGNYWERDFFGRQYGGIIVFAPRQTGPNPGQERFGTIGPEDRNAVTRTRIIQIRRMDNQPDTCGNAPQTSPPSIPPSFGPYTNIPITINIPGFGSVNIPVTFTLAPVVNIPIQGGLHVPVTVNVPVGPLFPSGGSFPVYFRLPQLEINTAISFNPNIDITPQIDFPRGGIDLPFVTRIIGANVQSVVNTGSPVSVINGNGSAPSLYVPRLATVRFTSPPFAGGRQSIDIDVKTLNQFVPCPWFFGAASFTVLPNVGVTCTSSPVNARVADLVRSV